MNRIALTLIDAIDGLLAQSDAKLAAMGLDRATLESERAELLRRAA